MINKIQVHNCHFEFDCSATLYDDGRKVYFITIEEVYGLLNTHDFICTGPIVINDSIPFLGHIFTNNIIDNNDRCTELSFERLKDGHFCTSLKFLRSIK